MNGLKTDKKRWWLSIFLNDLAVGQVFQPGLLHVTIMPWFVTELAEEQILESFKKQFSKTPSFELEIGKTVKFGPRKNVSVSLIRYEPRLSKLHQLSLEWLESLGGRWAVKNPYTAEQYTPHIRHRRGKPISAGQQIAVDSLYLIEARRQEDSRRRVTAKAALS
ncbi:MAG TPA: 2'-5' RNA ligase family protein [Candidatus Saccharimonadales bacterium]|nr:2'-5' RNA ligase family protein [Candidatus Saccharimonadales bacterium]